MAIMGQSQGNAVKMVQMEIGVQFLVLVMVFWFFFFFFSFPFWISNKNKIAVNCPYISNENNAEWVQTFANGQTITGNCINGYYGTISRTCTQDGSNGNWNAIIGSCNGILIFLSFFLSFRLWIKLDCNFK